MRKNGMKLAVFLTACAMIFAGCGGGSTSSSYYSGSSTESAKAAEDYGVANYDSYAEEDGIEPEYEDGSANGTSASGTEEGQEAADSEEKLVYTCDLRMQTLTYDETLANVRKEIEKVGGIIQSENETNSGSNWYYDDYSKISGEKSIYMTVRIPSKNYKSFLESLDGEGKILSKNSQVENITRRYHDTEAVIRNLEMQEDRLQAMMNEARTIEDMITIETRLTEVQTQLDQNRTYLSSMDTDVAYSTVNLRIEEVVRYSSDPPKTLTFGDRLQNALEGSLTNFLNFLETVLFAAIYIAPIALLVLVIVMIVLGINKAWRKKHPKKTKAPKPPKAPKGTRNAVPPQGGYQYGQMPQGMPGQPGPQGMPGQPGPKGMQNPPQPEPRTAPNGIKSEPGIQAPDAPQAEQGIKTPESPESGTNTQDGKPSGDGGK